MAQLALMNFYPNYCPNCGKDRSDDHRMSKQDFYRNASCACSCGFAYQYAPDKIILQASNESGGDLAHYYQ